MHSTLSVHLHISALLEDVKWSIAFSAQFSSTASHCQVVSSKWYAVPFLRFLFMLVLICVPLFIVLCLKTPPLALSCIMHHLLSNGGHLHDHTKPIVDCGVIGTKYKIVDEWMGPQLGWATSSRIPFNGSCI